MQIERRVLRSRDPARAIRIFLAKNARSRGIRAAVIASDEGMLLGGVGNEDLEVLAAVGSASDAGHDVVGACEQRCWPVDALFTRRLSIGERGFVVASLGASLKGPEHVDGLLRRLLA